MTTGSSQPAVSSSTGAPQIYVDSNVLLRVGQPDRTWFHDQSLHFLEHHRGLLVVGPIVKLEVDHQLARYYREYSRIGAVRHWLHNECRMLDLNEEQLLRITRLANRYWEAGWDGDPGDVGDRVHAATATVAQIPFLATWEKRFRLQRSLIVQANLDVGEHFAIQFIRPDEELR